MTEQTKFQRALLVTALVLASVAAGGCASTFNVGETEFACKEKEGCPTPIEVYEATHGNSSDVRMGRTPKSWKASSSDVVRFNQDTRAGKETRGLIDATAVKVPGDRAVRPLRSGSEVARIWIAPWIDEADNLHWARYTFVEISKRRWEVGEKEIRSGGTSVPFVQIRGDREPGAPRK